MGIFENMIMRIKTFLGIMTTVVVFGTVLLPTEIAISKQRWEKNSTVAPNNASTNKSQSGKKSNVWENTSAKNDPQVESVKKMYSEFVSLISTGISAKDMKSFFNAHFDVELITAKLTRSKKPNPKLTDALLKYFKFLLNGDVIKQVTNYQMSDHIKKKSGKNLIFFNCKLNKKDSKSANDALSMKVTISSKSLKITELTFMDQINLVGGAKNIIDLYCQRPDKSIDYKKLTLDKKIETCISALTAYVDTYSGAKR